MPTYRMKDLKPAERERIERQAQLEQDITDLQWECARLRYYCEALEHRVTQEQRAAAVDEAAAALAQHNPPERT